MDNDDAKGDPENPTRQGFYLVQEDEHDKKAHRGEELK